MKQKISFYLPLKITEDTLMPRDYGNNLWRTNLLLQSIDKFFTSSVDFLIVSPLEEISIIKKYLISNSKINITIIDQDRILNGITKANIPGWFKQQILTFAMVDCYPKLNLLKLDPDLLLVNNIDHDDFFCEEKTANDLWHIQANDRYLAYVRCSELLDIKIADQSLGTKWTPFIFNPTIVRELIVRLASKNVSLLDLGNYTCWTETLLYNIVINHLSDINKYHFHKSLIGSSLSNIKNIKHFKIQPQQGIFATLQGYTGIDYTNVLRILQNSNITI